MLEGRVAGLGEGGIVIVLIGVEETFGVEDHRIHGVDREMNVGFCEQIHDILVLRIWGCRGCFIWRIRRDAVLGSQKSSEFDALHAKQVPGKKIVFEFGPVATRRPAAGFSASGLASHLSRPAQAGWEIPAKLLNGKVYAFFPGIQCKKKADAISWSRLCRL